MFLPCILLGKHCVNSTIYGQAYSRIWNVHCLKAISDHIWKNVGPSTAAFTMINISHSKPKYDHSTNKAVHIYHACVIFNTVVPLYRCMHSYSYLYSNLFCSITMIKTRCKASPPHCVFFLRQPVSYLKYSTSSLVLLLSM